ncbi:MAG: response regulator [Burkholderiales bacterium]|nr:response regulator [Burkholderiales bacterium]
MTAPRSSVAPHEAGNVEQRTILVVEDDYQASKLLSLYLRQVGYQVVLARTGAEALECARHMHPSAITLDLLLPDMDGWEVLAELKGAPATRDIPVVIVSVLDRQSFGFKLGAVEYLVKPVARAELLRALGRCLLLEKSAGETHRVMVVHATAGEPQSFVTALASEGYDVIEVEGSQEAIHLAKCMSFDLLVVNVALSRKAGDEMISALHAEPLTCRIPSLILATEELVSQASGLCAENEIPVVWAPGTERTLLRTIEQLLNRTRRLGAEHE